VTTTDGPPVDAGNAGDAHRAAAGPWPAAGSSAARRRLDPDALAALMDERDFLLRSLADLEREHDAGDVDDHDYETLKDDYTARAARAIRAVDSHQARARAARRPRSWRRIVAAIAGVLAFAVLAGVLVAQASGRRGSGEALTGDIRQSTRADLAEALQTASEGDYAGAIAMYDEVLADEPANVEALTYKGWLQFQSGDGAGIESLIAAAEADPDYAPTHAFLAVILEQAGRTDAALAELDRLDALDPPPYILELVAGLRERLEAAAATPPSTAPAP
jgi:tetratricopeptide (TPR) repeat protein